MFTEVLMSAFNTSAGMLSGPAALLFFMDLIAFSISILVGGSQDISSSWVSWWQYWSVFIYNAV